MGLLSNGTPLSWKETKEYAEHVRKHGIKQFFHVYTTNKDRKRDPQLWGDEVEYMLVKIDHEHKTVRLSLRAQAVLKHFENEQDHCKGNEEMEDCGRGVITYRSSSINKKRPGRWHPEYAAYMLESTPIQPFGEALMDLLHLERNLKDRRVWAEQRLQKGENLLTITAFPLLGTDTPFSNAQISIPEMGGPYSRSILVPDEAISPHQRFPTLTANIRERRGYPLDICVPVYDESYGSEPQETLHMDSTCFGMGCCCLQVTLQCESLDEARFLYDQLTVVAPLLLALSAATPVLCGRLLDTDVRWKTISASVDDRTLEELQWINKSRYDSVSCFIALPSYVDVNVSKWNDVPLVIHPDGYAHLVEGGMDPLLAQHIAHLFIRDPLVVYREWITQDDHHSQDHFENIHSTNWQTVRLKQPELDKKGEMDRKNGWRVEFRPMEVQLTDFENAAYVIFIVLLTRVLLQRKFHLYIPLSFVDENMRRAHQRDAIHRTRFYFHVDDSLPKPSDRWMNNDQKAMQNSSQGVTNEDTVEEWTMDEIFNGHKSGWPGFVPLIKEYLLTSCETDREQISRALESYLSLIRQRAQGTLPTMATWMRNAYRSHPAYQKDSRVTEEMCYDVLYGACIQESMQSNRPPRWTDLE